MSKYRIATNLTEYGAKRVQRQVDKHTSEAKRNKIRKERKQKQLQRNSF